MSEVHFQDLPPVSIGEISRGIPRRPDLAEGKDTYRALATYPMNLAVLKTGQYTDYLVCGPELDGLDINCLLYAVAPYKGFGWDTDDIKKDWTDLFEDQSSEMVARLARHRQIPNWFIFEDARVLLLDAIKKGQVDRINERANLLVPVMRWRVDVEGRRSWLLSLDDDQIMSYLVNIYGEKIKDQAKASTVLGLLYHAAYSPDITNNRQTWPLKMGYNPKSNRRQDIGPTQVLPLILMNANELLTGQLTPNLEAYSAHPVVQPYQQESEQEGFLVNYVPSLNWAIKPQSYSKGFPSIEKIVLPGQNTVYDKAQAEIMINKGGVPQQYSPEQIEALLEKISFNDYLLDMPNNELFDSLKLQEQEQSLIPKSPSLLEKLKQIQNAQLNTDFEGISYLQALESAEYFWAQLKAKAKAIAKNLDS